ALEHPAHQLFAATGYGSVHVGGVEEEHAAREGRVEHGTRPLQRLGHGARPAEVVASESCRGHDESGCADATLRCSHASTVSNARAAPRRDATTHLTARTKEDQRPPTEVEGLCDHAGGCVGSDGGAGGVPGAAGGAVGGAGGVAGGGTGAPGA